MAKSNSQSQTHPTLDMKVTKNLIIRTTMIEITNPIKIPLILKFIGIPLMNKINELETPTLLFIGDRAQTLTEEVNLYLYTIYKYIIDNNDLDNNLSDHELKEATHAMARTTIDAIFKRCSIDKVLEAFSDLKVSGRHKIPLIKDFHEHNIDAARIVHWITSYSNTFDELKVRLRILIKCVKKEGMNFNSNQILLQQLIESDRIRIDHEVLTGTINGLISMSQDYLHNETCNVNLTKIFIKHLNCNMDKESKGQIISEIQIPKNISDEIRVCEVTPEDIDDNVWNSTLTDDSKINAGHEEYITPTSFTTSITTTLHPSKYIDNHSMSHQKEKHAPRAISIRSGPECEILMKHERNECKIEIRTGKKITKGTETVNMYYGVMQSIDKFQDKYGVLMSASESSELDSLRQDFYSFLRIWEQSKE